MHNLFAAPFFCLPSECGRRFSGVMFTTILSLLAVALLWGVTNPFIKIGSQGIDKVNTSSKWTNLRLELKLIATRLRYWIPFLLNQSGSVLYVWVLQKTNITVAVPVSNSLSFVFTAITGYMLGEQIPGKKIIIGTLLVCIGSTLMIYDDISKQNFVKEAESQLEFNDPI